MTQLTKPVTFLGIAFLILTFLTSSLFAQDQATPSSSPDVQENENTNDSPVTENTTENAVTLSKPVAVPTEPNLTVPGNQKPSQGEGEKAPVSSRPTAVPEFSLPEVVITGENELTINAQRLDRKENDVTLGTHDLTGVERSLNDLPGLSKTFTALATEEAGPSKDTALVLHLGGGTPNTYGGWGLLGQEFKDVQYLLSGFGSNWGGQSTGLGLDGDRRYGFGGQIYLFQSEPKNLTLSGNFTRLDAELPYQGSLREIHDGVQGNLEGHWKLTELTQAQLNITEQSTYLNYWDMTPKSNQTQEWEGRFKVSADAIGPFLNKISMEVGGRRATSDFSLPASTAYDWGWIGLHGYFKSGENLNLTVKLQTQTGNGLDLPLKLYPALDFTWRVFGNSQLDLYWQSDRYVESFNKTFMGMEHVSPEAGFPAPTEITSEWGGRFTQKISEAILLSLSASTAQIQNYHQWTDINPLNPLFIQDYSTVGQVQMNKAGVNLQWNFMKDWQALASYEWTHGSIQSTDVSNLTGLPTHRGILSLYRGDETLETRVDLQLASERQEFDSQPGTLPAYVTLGFDATYHLSKTFSLWFNADNLWGQSFQLQPGYLEPQYHVRGGIEVIF